MKKLALSYMILLSASTLIAYQDIDIDGIEDSIDRCLNTPLAAYVNRYGCASEEKIANNEHFKQLTLSLGTTLQRDDVYDDSDNLNFYANYRFDVWDFSLSNIQSNAKTTYSEETSDGDSDFYLSLGHTTFMDNASIRLSGGMKIVDDTDATRDNDYFVGLNYDYFITKKQDIFLYGSYTFSGDSESVDYEDYNSFSLGYGYLMSPAWYSALSYNFTDSIYSDGEADEVLSWFNSYQMSKNFFLTGVYSYGLADVSYDHTLSMSLGLKF